MNSLIAVCGGKPERREAETRTGKAASLLARAEGIARILKSFGPLFWDARNPTHQALALFKPRKQSSSICAYVVHFPVLSSLVPDVLERRDGATHERGKTSQGRGFFSHV